MKGKLLLDYYSNKTLNKSSVKCRISLTQPTWFSGVDHNLESLFPSPELLRSYKNGELSDNEYTKIYIDHLLNCESVSVDLDLIKSYLNAGRDVSLLCWCGPESFCHRLIIGTLFTKMGYSVMKVNKGTLINFDGSY